MSNLKIAIVGPGVVGQATGKAFLAKGLDVTFIGVDPKNIQDLKQQGLKVCYPTQFSNGNYNFDITFLTVPTPTKNDQIDLSFMEKAAIDVGKHLAHRSDYHLVVVKSTVLPGTTENLVIPLIEKYSGKQVGRDFGVCMNPEYLREKTAVNDALDPWMILIGQYDRRSGNLLNLAYEDFDSPIYRCSIKEAEMEKYIHNLFNATKITFFNEMRQIGQAHGLDIEKVFKLATVSTEGIWNHRYGIKDKGPFSGSCLPKDTQAYLAWVENQGLRAEMLKSVIAVNREYAKKHTVKEEDRSKSHLPL